VLSAPLRYIYIFSDNGFYKYIFNYSNYLLYIGFGEVTFAVDSLCSSSFDINKVRGLFEEGKLQGQGVVTFVDGSLMKGTFVKGVLHGLARKFRCKFGPCDLFEREEWSKPKFLWEVSESLRMHFHKQMLQIVVDQTGLPNRTEPSTFHKNRTCSVILERRKNRIISRGIF
jgi:hypothetical protein